MRLTIELFAALSQLVEAKEVSVDVPDNTTVGELLAHLVTLHPSLSEMLGSVSVAVNMSYARSSDVLNEHDEVALIPPVSGG